MTNEVDFCNEDVKLVKEVDLTSYSKFQHPCNPPSQMNATQLKAEYTVPKLMYS